eukprot:gnl/TRDRNA2_/TRDRNA2_61117_c0_seq1.p2 gnl/TRDRNA2_/TRDRNA2_61117_c0~~gnl/TRDRNA2_/TRDRNA2_61117_c0_seq1.p2  ORF type:complete len:237 (-),score=61.89 gnl/TRDRNA2_/TRDRNA2_61117_c0_seq1:100-810(-)
MSTTVGGAALVVAHSWAFIVNGCEQKETEVLDANDSTSADDAQLAPGASLDADAEEPEASAQFAGPWTCASLNTSFLEDCDVSFDEKPVFVPEEAAAFEFVAVDEFNLDNLVTSDENLRSCDFKEQTTTTVRPGPWTCCSMDRSEDHEATATPCMIVGRFTVSPILCLSQAPAEKAVWCRTSSSPGSTTAGESSDSEAEFDKVSFELPAALPLQHVAAPQGLEHWSPLQQHIVTVM